MADENKEFTSKQGDGGGRHEPTTDEIIAAVQAALAKSMRQNSDEDTDEDIKAAEEPLKEEPAAPEAEEPVEEKPAVPEAEEPVEENPAVPEAEVPVEAAPAAPEAEEPVEEKTAAEDPAAAEPVSTGITAELPDVEKIISEAVAPADAAAVPSEEVPQIQPEISDAQEAAPSGNTEMIMDLKEKLEEAVKEDQLAKQEAAKKAAREAKAKKIEKRNRAIIRRRIILASIAAAVLAVVLIIVHLFRAGTWEDRAEVNTLTLNADGSIVYEEILNIEDASKKELKSYVEEQISSYNEASGEEKITLNRFASEKNGYYMRMTYADSAAYAEFTGYWITTGSIQSSINAGITFPETMVAVEDGEKGDSVTADEVQKETDLKLLTIRENTTVVVPGVIQYITDECTTIGGDDTVTITAVEDDADAAALTYIIYSADNDVSSSDDSEE